MINPKELRIGNYIRISDFEPEGYHELYTTSDVQITGFNDGSDIIGSKLICFYKTPSKIGGYINSGIRDIYSEPIPLTEKKLFQLGFERTDNYNDYYKLYSNGRLEICYIEDTRMFSLFEKSTNSFNITPIYEPFQYVHQLQNIYHALTQQELILTTNTI